MNRVALPPLNELCYYCGAFRIFSPAREVPRELSMQQRQLRLGDILDDYCPRERRLTNHAVVAMVGDEVKQTRCTTCDAEHEFKHAKVPRQRRKNESAAALLAPVVPGAVPKRVVMAETKSEPDDEPLPEVSTPTVAVTQPDVAQPDLFAQAEAIDLPLDDEDDDDGPDVSDGPAHRRLIRATLPRQEGQQPPARPAPDFTIRQPATGRPNRFRPRPQRGGQSFQGNRSNSQGGPTLTGMPRQGNSRPPTASRPVKRHDQGRKRPK
jgi:hypothetical protein